MDIPEALGSVTSPPRSQPDAVVPYLPGQVTVVTVTYGNRQHLLEPMLRAVLALGIHQVILVDNAVTWDILSLANQVDAARIKMVRLERNTGSAGGFAAGIKFARQCHADLIWLLDDDNMPVRSALTDLLDAYSRLRQDHGVNKLAVVGLRPTRAVARPPHRRMMKPPADVIPLAMTVFGGLLFHISLIDTVGLPREDFVLYGEDTEFTYRITRQGGRIYLVPTAQVQDLDCDSMRSWIIRCAGLDLPDGLSAIYYYRRNSVYFETHCKPRVSPVYRFKLVVYLALLFVLSHTNRRYRKHYRTIKQAISDGWHARLGYNPEYPLM